MFKFSKLLFLFLLLINGQNLMAFQENDIYHSETLRIYEIAPNIYQHLTYLDAGSFGKVACNGMIVSSENEAIIFDTPSDDKTSLELIGWVKDSLHCKIKAVVPTHFHQDCLGGLAAFHQQHIPSYANNLTIQLAKINHTAVPEKGFHHQLKLKAGDKKIEIFFAGEGHTKDNVVAYFPKDKILFGGCLVKELGAGKGNLEDANVNVWAATVKKLKVRYPEAQIVIPGHGKIGDSALLDYTIRLFEN